jgi:hypothetical protein
MIHGPYSIRFSIYLTVQGIRVVAEVLEPLLLPPCPVLSIYNKYRSLLLDLNQQKGI